MTVTPAVSADRRYVRLSVNPFFNDVNGFTSFTTPLGAVGGAGGGWWRPGRRRSWEAASGGAGGRRAAAAAGVSAAAGRRRRLQRRHEWRDRTAPGSTDSVGFGPIGFGGQVGEMRAGALPSDDGGLGRSCCGAGHSSGPDRLGTTVDYVSSRARPTAQSPRRMQARANRCRRRHDRPIARDSPFGRQYRAIKRLDRLTSPR